MSASARLPRVRPTLTLLNTLRTPLATLCAAVVVLCFGAAAQQPPSAAPAAPPASPNKSVRAVRLDDARLRLDGELDEPAWQQAALIDGFTQTTPDLGKPVSEKTEVLIFYDSQALYFGFRCYD